MFSNSLTACVLAISLASVAAVPAVAAGYDLGRLSPAAYPDAIGDKTPSDKLTEVFTSAIPESYVGEVAAMVKNLPFLEPFWETKKVSMKHAPDEIASSERLKSYSDLAKRDYASDATGENTGSYPSSFVPTLSPDPETTSIAMLLAGLGLIITTARRRTAHR